MKKSEYKRQQREAAAKAKPPSKMQQLQNAVNNLQNLLWLCAHQAGGSITIPREVWHGVDLASGRVEVHSDPETGSYTILAIRENKQ